MSIAAHDDFDLGAHARHTRVPRRHTNLGSLERALSVTAAAALGFYGLRRRDLGGLALAVVGGALMQRGLTGRRALQSAPGPSSGDGGRVRLRKQRGGAAVLDASQARKVEDAVTVSRPRAELYRFWRDLENLPRVMRHLESVTVLNAERSRWKAKAPAGAAVEWDAVIINEIENELIAWKSVDEADVRNAGSVHFRDAAGGRGTELRVVLEYDPPAGRLGAAVATLLGEEPNVQVREDLRRFKQLVETGEIATTEGQPSGRR